MPVSIKCRGKRLRAVDRGVMRALKADGWSIVRISRHFACDPKTTRYQLSLQEGGRKKRKLCQDVEIAVHVYFFMFVAVQFYAIKSRFESSAIADHT